MAKMTCRCGELLSNNDALNDIELKVYTDKEWDDILNVVCWVSFYILNQY